ncbi:single-stranded DNA-binding protein 2 [Arthrobacter sp. Hiyo8]|nr:single-stranded DNA-binding protein 2 [Arthrobacter sp. Hiyo8]
MNDIITVRGFVATEPKSSTTPGGTRTASFRLGSTERRFDRANDVWADGNTNWFSVQAFRHLAGNIGCSVKKGQRVIVVGKLKLRQWEHDGKIYQVAEIVAESVGHDLMWGSANFIRTTGSNSPQTMPAAPRWSQRTHGLRRRKMRKATRMTTRMAVPQPSGKLSFRQEKAMSRYSLILRRENLWTPRFEMELALKWSRP